MRRVAVRGKRSGLVVVVVEVEEAGECRREEASEG